MAVQFCGTCGHPLIPEQLFCQHCGTRADENATRSSPPATPGIPVSSAGTLYCGECGALVGSQDRVCRRCGAPVEPTVGGVSDPSLSDAPTMMGTPPPAAYQPPQAYQVAQPAAYQPPTPPPYQVTPSPSGPPGSGPGYAPQQPPGWGASYSPNPANDSPTYTFSAPRPGVQAPPYQPPRPGGPPPQQSRSKPLVIAIVLVALVLIIGGGVVLAHPFSSKPQGNGSTPGVTPGITQTTGPTVTPTPTEVALNQPNAEALVRQFYQDINMKNYDAAYALLSAEWQATQTLANFTTGYQNTLLDTLTIDNSAVNADGTVQVNIHLTAEETGGTKNFAGYYTVVKENGKLLLGSKRKINQV